MIDILFPVHNRLEFTKVAATALAQHTNKSLVDTVYVYDDRSVDGAAQAAYEILRGKFNLLVTVASWDGFGGPVAIMRDYIRQSTVELFAKIDNDTVVCPQWLEICLEVMKQKPTLDLLGIEPHTMIVDPSMPVSRHTVSARFIGGIGLMRTRAFGGTAATLIQSGTYFGFTSWQTEHENVEKGWLNPALPITLLDRIPVPPWSDLSSLYIRNGWQRPYGVYDMASSFLWESLKLVE